MREDRVEQLPTATEPVQASAAARQSPWRFSLRELLLLTTTVAVVAAFVANNLSRQPQPFSPSRLSAEFGQSGHLVSALKRAGQKNHVPFSGGGGRSGHGNAMHADRMYYLDVPPELRGPLMQQLEQDARAMLTKDQLEVRGTGKSKSGDIVTAFELAYYGAALQGHLAVRTINLSGDRIALLVYIYEHAPAP